MDRKSEITSQPWRNLRRGSGAERKRSVTLALEFWSFGQERAYPELDFVRAGELSIKIKDEYVRRLRRTWPIFA